MPTYNFRNKETGEITEVDMRISELDQFKQDNPQLETIIGSTALHSGQGLGKKPDQSFRELLKHIKKGNSKGHSKSTINDW